MSIYKNEYLTSYLLAIGINEYFDSRFTPLGNAETDAREIANILSAEPYGFQVEMLLGPEATKQAIQRALFRLRSAGSDDRVLIYFAGHGYTLTNKRGHETGYLACADTLPDQDFTALELEEVTGLRDYSDAKHISFIFDACFSGQALGLTRGISEGFLDRRAYQVLSAGAGDQTVSDYQSMTRLLLNTLRSPGSETITLNNLGLEIQNAMRARSKGRQIPQFGHLTDSQGGDFVFLMGTSLAEHSREAKSQGHKSQAQLIRAAIERLESGDTPGTSGVEAIRPENIARLVESLRLSVAEGGGYGVAFSPDDLLLAAGSTQKAVLLWNLKHQPDVTLLKGHESSVRGVAFNPEGQQLASTSGDGHVRLWDLSSLSSVVLGSHDGYVYDVQFSPTGQVVASVAVDGLIHLWNPTTLEAIGALIGHRGAAFSVAFSPDSRLLASSSADKTIRLWDMASLQEIGQLVGHTGTVWGVVFHPDGHILASASGDHSVRVWDRQTRTEIAHLIGHSATVRGVCFDPSGTLIASASFDQTIRLWDLQKLAELRTLKGPRNKVECVAFSHSGAQLVASSHDNTIRFWSIR